MTDVTEGILPYVCLAEWKLQGSGVCCRRMAFLSTFFHLCCIQDKIMEVNRLQVRHDPVVLL